MGYGYAASSGTILSIAAVTKIKVAAYLSLAKSLHFESEVYIHNQI